MRPHAPVIVGTVFAAWTCLVTTSAAQTLEPIRYIVRFPEPHTHVVHLEAIFPTGRQPYIDLMMPVWTPGSYLVREYSRHVTLLTAEDAASHKLSVVKTRKNRWRVTTGGAPSVTVRYTVYGREMSVRTNWVESRFAMLNGAPTFMTLVDHTPRRHDIQLVLPAEWTSSITAMPAAPDGVAHHYLAQNYDVLVDSPILAGNPSRYQFTVSGTTLTLVNEGEDGVWDGAGSARDTEAIVRATERIWGGLPFQRYVLFNMITEANGGLEHLDSALLMTNRWRTRNRTDYLGWLGLVSHEFFHAWNGKRLRPVELGPFDYENEVHTENLWVYEGFTDYYDNLVLRRAALVSDEEYLTALSGAIGALQTTPGRLVQTAAEASYDAWIRYYRPDENSPNVSISYYTKGGVVAFLLDADIRRATGGQRSLDDVMRAAFAKYSGVKGYTSEEFRATASAVAGTDLTKWFEAMADGTAELDYASALEWLGLRFKPASGRPAKASLGVRTRVEGGRLLVGEVRRDTPAIRSGLDVDDEIIAIDDFRVRADQLENRLDKYRVGQEVVVLVARRERLLRLQLTLDAEATEQWQLEVTPSATDEQKARRAAWLGGV